MSHRLRTLSAEEIVANRILPAAYLNPETDREAVAIYDPRPLPLGLRAAGSKGFLREMDSTYVDCQGHCDLCTSILQVGGDISQRHDSRLVIADTGIEPVARNQASELFYPRQATDFSDVSKFHHGTFIYTQVANNFFGPVDPSDIKIARVAVKDPEAITPEPDAYSLSIVEVFNFVQSLKASHKLYAADLYKKEKRIAPTWIMNLSMYGPIDNDLSNFYLADAYPRLLYVAAAGNGPEPRSLLSSSIYTYYDAGNSNVLIVGALDHAHEVAGYSNHDSKYVDLFAQGSCVCGDAWKFDGKNPDLENQINGTSQAAPIVAAAAKIIAERFPGWSAQQIKWRLIATTDRLDDLQRSAKGGELNLPRALNNDPRKTLIVIKERDIPVDYIDPSVPAWSKLLEKSSEDDVLRVHKKADCPDKKLVCFQLMHYEEGIDATVKIPAKTKLPYSQGNGETKYIEADKLIDLIQPFRMK